VSYAQSAALQAAVYTALSDNTALSDAVDGAILDAIPSGTAPDLFVALGPEAVLDKSDGTGGGAIHDFQITIISAAAVFLQAKTVAALVSDILIDAPLVLARGKLVSLRFLKARANRIVRDDTRRIDIWFRARVTDTI
jgi:hypothetical protein